MTQYGVNKGLKLYKDRGAEAIIKEPKQLDETGSVEPRKMTEAEKLGALRYLMFLKEKRCGRIKGRGCADGRKQREYINKEEASSPTVSTEALMLSCIVDAREEREVATLDIPGAFLHARMDEKVIMRIDGAMADLLVKINPEKYKPFLEKQRGKPVIFVQLKNALYGTLKAALLFWQHLSNNLVQKWGFKLNPYDRCVANKLINGKQCTILWHVDDLKISHVDPNVIEDIISKLDKAYGQNKDTPLAIHRGKTHDYQGMTIIFSEKGKVVFTMFKYIQEIIDESPEEFVGKAETPAATHLFEVDDEKKPIKEKKSRLYHHLTTKLLYLCKRARPDMQTAVSFLCTRVKASTEDN